MNRLALLIALAGSILAAPYPHIRRYQFSGPHTLVAGQRHFASFKPLYGFDVTCVAATDVCTAGNGYTPVNGDLGTLDTTGTVPGGLYTIVNNAWPNYYICNASGSTFKLFEYPNNCTGSAVDITSTGSGTHTFVVYNYNSGSDIYLDAAPTGLPTSTTVEWRTAGAGAACNTAAPTSGGKVYSEGGGDQNDGTLCLLLTVPSDAAPGTGTYHLTFCQTTGSSNCTTFDWTYTVVAVSAPSYTPPSSFSTVPGKTTWITTMTATGSEAGGGTYCTNPSAPTETYAGMPEASVAYYDGMLTYYNIANYISTPVWENCGTNIAGYADTYLTDNAGGIPAYKVYGAGLWRATAVTGVSSYATAAVLLQNSTYVLYGARPTLGYDRELSLALQYCVDLYRNTVISCTYWSDLRDVVYGFLLRYTETSSDDRADTQGFYMGLMMKALIADWQISFDPRIKYVLDRSLDRLTATYNLGTHTMMYALGVNGGPWCASDYLWFVGDPYFNCQVNTGQKLQNLVSPAFSFLWALTGGTTYRDNFDEWFEHTFDAGIYTGKEFAQINYLAFDGVGWRDGTVSAYQEYPAAIAGATVAGNVIFSGSVRLK